MNKDELLLKYFENNLSDEEGKIFNELIKKDVEFQKEFKRLEIIDKELNGLAPNLTSADNAFIENVKKNLSRTNLKSNLSYKLTRPLYFFIASALLITVIVALIFINKNNPDGTTINNGNIIKQTEQQNSVVAEQGNASDNSSYSMNINEDKHENIVKGKEKEKVRAKELTVPENQTDTTQNDKGKIKGNIFDKNPVKNQEIIVQLRNKLKEYHNAGDLLNETWTLKRLGIVFRQLGDYSKSNNYLNQALNLSSSVPDATLKADIFGEIAYLNFVRGNIREAIDFKEKCLEILEPSSAARAEYWKKKFIKFEQN